MGDQNRDQFMKNFIPATPTAPSLSLASTATLARYEKPYNYNDSSSKPVANGFNAHKNHHSNGNVIFIAEPISSSTPVEFANQKQRPEKTPKSLFSHVKIEHLIAGISGGVTPTLVLHPLDLLKTRLAVNDGQASSRPTYHGLRNAVSTILREEGMRGLYRGVTPNCWGAGASWGLYFLFYNAIKAYMLEDGKKKTLSAGFHMLAAAEAGVLTLLITNPIWVVKTRMCLQYSTVAGLPPSKHYSGMMDALIKIYRHEGLRGMYKGLIPGMFGVSHGALQFMAYEEMKKSYLDYYHLSSDETLSTAQYLSFAAMSKLFAATVTYPYQVVRARLQDQHKEYSGVHEVIKRMWRFEGVVGFYKGIIPNLLKVTPATAITFVVYENLSKYLLKSKPG